MGGMNEWYKDMYDIRNDKGLILNIASLSKRSEKPQFQDTSLDRITSSVAFFRTAFQEYLELDGSDIDDLEKQSPGLKEEILSQAASAESVIMRNQLKSVCDDKNYSIGKLAHFLAEALDVKDVEKLAELLALAQKGLGNNQGLFTPEERTTRATIEIKTMDKENAKELIAAMVFYSRGFNWGQKAKEVFGEGCSAEDKKFMEMCELFEKIKGLAFLVESTFKNLAIYNHPDNFGDEHLEEMYRRALSAFKSNYDFDTECESDEAILAKTFNKPEVLKSVFAHLMEKGFFFTDRFPVAAMVNNDSGTRHMRVFEKSRWIRPEETK